MELNKDNRVLVIDDDPLIRHILQSILEAEGYHVKTAENGLEGFDLLQNEGVEKPFSFIVLDMMMPKMTGIEVLESVRQLPNFSEIPIIMLTAENKPGDVLGGYTAGANYYMTKPFTREQLLLGIKLIKS